MHPRGKFPQNRFGLREEEQGVGRVDPGPEKWSEAAPTEKKASSRVISVWARM